MMKEVRKHNRSKVERDFGKYPYTHTLDNKKIGLYTTSIKQDARSTSAYFSAIWDSC